MVGICSGSEFLYYGLSIFSDMLVAKINDMNHINNLLK